MCSTTFPPTAPRPLPASSAHALWQVKLKGKGNVVRRMFADVDADVYVMVDGDATYHAASVRRMVDTLIDEQLNMGSGFACRGHGRPAAHLPSRSSSRQQALDRQRADDLRRRVHRHAVALPGVLPALCQVVSRAVARLRGRDRADRARAGVAHALRRAGHTLRRTPRGLGQQAVDVPRWLAHPADHRAAADQRRSPCCSSACWARC